MLISKTNYTILNYSYYPYRHICISIGLYIFLITNLLLLLLAIRMPAINPANTMQQSMGSQQGIMSTSIQSPQQGNQQSGSQQPIQAGIDPGNLPIIPNPPIQGQNKDRKIIWSGNVDKLLNKHTVLDIHVNRVLNYRLCLELQHKWFLYHY